MSASISVCWNACPMCSVPVTFGGGSWMEYAGLSLEGSAANQPADSQRAYHLPSTARGSKLLSSGMLGRQAQRLDGRQQLLLAREHSVAGRSFVAAPANDAGTIDEKLPDQLDPMPVAIRAIAVGRLPAVASIEHVAQ